MMSLFKILTFINLFLVFYLALEAVKRLFRLNPKVTRKTAHCVSGIMVICLFYFLDYYEYLLAAAFFVLFFVFSRAKKLLTSIHIEDRVTFGEIYYPVGVFLTILLAYSNKFVAVTSIAILIVSDTVAEGVGTWHGANGKSPIGSLAFLFSAAVTIVASAVLFEINLNFLIGVKLITVALLATVAEASSPFGSDNATVPLTTVVCLGLLL